MVYQLATSVQYLVSKDPAVNRTHMLTPPPRSNTTTPPLTSTTSGRPIANLLSSPFRPPSEHSSPRMSGKLHDILLQTIHMWCSTSAILII